MWSLLLKTVTYVNPLRPDNLVLHQENGFLPLSLFCPWLDIKEEKKSSNLDLRVVSNALSKIKPQILETSVSQRTDSYIVYILLSSLVFFVNSDQKELWRREEDSDEQPYTTHPTTRTFGGEISLLHYWWNSFTFATISFVIDLQMGVIVEYFLISIS